MARISVKPNHTERLRVYLVLYVDAKMCQAQEKLHFTFPLCDAEPLSQLLQEHST